MDYKTNLVLHISFSFFFLFLVHCLYSIVFLISFMDFLINKLYLVILGRFKWLINGFTEFMIEQ